MKTYLADIIPKIKRFSQKLDNISLLTNQHWVVIDEMSKAKNVYIFRENGELLISQDGRVEKAKWEYLGNDALLIDRKDESYLFRHGFFDENVMALKVDGREEYAFLVNETKYKNGLHSIDQIIKFLSYNYLQHKISQSNQKKISPSLSIRSGTLKNHPEIGYKKEYLPPYIPIFGTPATRWKIIYSDGKSGVIYIEDDGQSYFKPLRYSDKRIIHKNQNDCINGLYRYLKEVK